MTVACQVRKYYFYVRFVNNCTIFVIILENLRISVKKKKFEKLKFVQHYRSLFNYQNGQNDQLTIFCQILYLVLNSIFLKTCTILRKIYKQFYILLVDSSSVKKKSKFV